VFELIVSLTPEDIDEIEAMMFIIHLKAATSGLHVFDIPVPIKF